MEHGPEWPMEDDMELKPGQVMVGAFMGKPAKAWRLMNSNQWAMKYFMPDGSTYGPFPCYSSELAGMRPFPACEEIFGDKLGYYPRSIMEWAQFHAIYIG